MFRCWLSAASIGPPPGGAALVGSPAGGPEGVSGPLGSGMVGSSAIDVPRGRATRKLPLDCTSMQHEAVLLRRTSPATALTRWQPKHIADQFLLILFLSGLGLFLLAIPEPFDDQLGTGRMQHVHEVLGVDRAGAGERNGDLPVVLGERRRRAVAVDHDLKILRELTEQELLAVVALVDERIHRLHDAQAYVAGVGELALDASGLINEAGGGGPHQSLRVNASSHTGLALPAHDRRKPARFVEHFPDEL